MFSINEKVVCLKYDPYNEIEERIVSAPRKGDMCVINWMDTLDGVLYLGFEGYDQETCWESKYFRKLDYAHTENIIREICELVKEEELELTN